MREIKNIIFDLDGTLIDSIPDIHKSINKSLEYINLPEIPIDNIRKYVGNGAKALIKRTLNYFVGKYDKKYLESLEEKMYNFYIQYYYEHCIDETYLYEGVGDTLKKLFESNIDMFIITNKPNDIAVNTIKKLNIFNYFKAIIGDGIYPYRKPDINIWFNLKNDYNLIEDKTIMVGDGIPDYEFAKNSGIKVLLALYGITDKNILLDLKNDYYINSFFEVYDFFNK
ncbi:HAD family hydrolase [Brachyspira sp.]|uniref:HAD family hydrolase n=1 Tax=Brachyspira sp. TaxID=1977261 RepID=UPI003D7DA104